MKRSEINATIREAERFFTHHQLSLPAWASWTPAQWHEHRDETFTLRSCHLGWDLTDFGRRRFSATGLLLFTLRNGRIGVDGDKRYAEKAMIVRLHQETPYHFHWHKMEDIINRGGGMLVIELQQADHETEEPTSQPFEVSIDGISRACRPGERVRLRPGESITLEPYVYHRFWAEEGDCYVGEVSTVNDDHSDNRFLESVGRFPTIEEDEERYRLLVCDYDR